MDRVTTSPPRLPRHSRCPHTSPPRHCRHFRPRRPRHSLAPPSLVAAAAVEVEEDGAGRREGTAAAVPGQRPAEPVSSATSRREALRRPLGIPRPRTPRRARHRRPGGATDHAQGLAALDEGEKGLSDGCMYSYGGGRWMVMADDNTATAARGRGRTRGRRCTGGGAIGGGGGGGHEAAGSKLRRPLGLEGSVEGHKGREAQGA